MNTTMSSKQIQEFLNLAEQKGLTPERMTTVLSSGILADVLDAGADLSNREVFRRAIGLDVIFPETIILEVNYGESLEEMVGAGKYDYCNGDITADRFDVSGKGIVRFEAKLIHPNRNVSYDDVVAKIKAIDVVNPWMPSKIEHLLAFGKQFPNEQRKYPIVGPGSVVEVDGRLGVPCLIKRRSAKRHLSLFWFRVNDCGTLCRFLAVRGISPAHIV